MVALLLRSPVLRASPSAFVRLFFSSDEIDIPEIERFPREDDFRSREMVDPRPSLCAEDSVKVVRVLAGDSGTINSNAFVSARLRPPKNDAALDVRVFFSVTFFDA